MPFLADGSFMIEATFDICDREDKHIWLYETPSFRYCKECGLTQHYAYTLYEWVDLEQENVFSTK
jgi:hypothetical protein